MKNKFTEIKKRTSLVIAILVVIGVVWGCDYQTEEPSAIETKTPTSIAINEPLPEATEIPYVSDNTVKSTSDEKSNLTRGQRSALDKAGSYLDFTAFSHDGLIEQLEYEGFSNNESVYAADNCGADWNEQAAKKAKDYLDTSSFSRSGLIEQLEYEGFTSSQAEYGADAVGYEETSSDSTNESSSNTAGDVSATLGQQNVLSKAEEYLSFSSFSYNGLVEQLEYEGFSNEEAGYAADNCGADWNEQATKKAQEYLDTSSFSRSGLIEQLEYEGFTSSQAEYGVDAVGY